MPWTVLLYDGVSNMSDNRNGVAAKLALEENVLCILIVMGML